MDRQALYDRIDRRVDAMIDAGLLDEVRGLLSRGYGEDLKSMQSLGYRHMVDYLEGRLSWEEAVRTLKRDTRRFAKRQLTWFRADTEIVWSMPDNIGALFPKIAAFLRDDGRYG
ncbi:MAG: tRNA dimethylallyltransferase, partial [Desulfobacterales bacterium]